MNRYLQIALFIAGVIGVFVLMLVIPFIGSVISLAYDRAETWRCESVGGEYKWKTYEGGSYKNCEPK